MSSVAFGFPPAIDPGQRSRRCHQRLLHVAVLLLACSGIIAGSARAGTLTSTVLEDNGATSNGLDGNQNVYDNPVPGPGVLTTSGGYDFTSTGYMALTSITSITVTLTMQDGNSDSGSDGFDYNHLHLALDGTDTGLILNGFRGNALEDTLTFTGTPTNAATILASLQADGKLNGTVTTDNPNDTITMPNEIYFGNDANDATTTLSISGTEVPEPGAATWAGLGLLTVAGLGRRGRRRMTARA